MRQLAEYPHRIAALLAAQPDRFDLSASCISGMYSSHPGSGYIGPADTGGA